jgi:hypothetical protein
MDSSEIDDYVRQHEQHLRRVVTMRDGLQLLEIGIGPAPNIERLRLFQHHGVKYTGVDFASVCALHVREIRQAGLPEEAFEFRSNTAGTYAWTLFEMLEQAHRFDVVYLDGHHTFYVDAPAIFLGDRLLVEGGYFLMDDIRWTLGAFEATMLRHPAVWRFYRKMYDLSAFTSDQRSLPHVGLMAQRILVSELGYGVDQDHSTPYWWALQKPPHKLPAGVPTSWKIAS